MAVYTTIDNPELYFQVKLYTGTGSAASITLDGDENMQPDMVWFKNRSSAGNNHLLYDSVRGTTKTLKPSSDAAEATDSNGLTAFNSDGFSIGDKGSLNNSSDNIVAWCWKETADAGFDILTFEGNSTDDTDISHNLSAVPHFMIVRNFDAAKEWVVYHHKNTSAPETDQLVLNTTAATTDSDDKWSDEAPTSSVFTVGDSSQLNQSSHTSIAYLWSEKQGFSKFGSFTGNGNADGPFIYTGFRPAYLLVKNASSSGYNWEIRDNKRDPDNVIDYRIYADTSGADASGNPEFDFLSNGIKIRAAGNNYNKSGDTMVYMAFAEQPFVNSKGVPCNAR